jgi:hypothetical protein
MKHRMKIIILFWILICFFSACGNEDTPYIHSQIPDGELIDKQDISTSDNTHFDGVVWDVDIETDTIQADGKAVLKVLEATEEFLSEYNSYIEFVDNEIGFKFAFIPHITIRNFQWIEVNHRMGDNNIVYYQQSVLYSAGDLTPGTPFVVISMDDDMPRRGISFVDEQDKRRYFAIMGNVADPEERPGMFIIMEFAQDDYVGEILFMGMPILEFMDLPYNDVIAILYGPINRNEVPWWGVFAEYTDMTLFFPNETNELANFIVHNPQAFYIDGGSMDKNREELIELFGTPTYEGNYEPYDDYIMTFQVDNYCFWFALPDENGRVISFEIWDTTNEHAGYGV